MVHSCSAYNCTERYRKGGLAFHRFPTSQELRDEWIKALRRSNFTPNQYSKLCAKHFTPDCYETAPWSCMKRLKEGAVPTIFEFSQRRKYQKKSLDECSVRIEEREHDDVTQCLVDVPVSRSPSRRKQLIIERKDFDTNNADLSEIQPHESLSKQTELSEDEVQPDNFAPLPSKRCRKKKTFPSDFVSTDWASRRRSRVKKCTEEDEEAKDLDLKISRLGVGKCSEINILETEKESAEQDEPIAIFSHNVNNESSVEIFKGFEISSGDGRKSTNVECEVVENIILNQALDGSDHSILKSISRTVPDETNFKENETKCDQVNVRNEEKNVMVESTGDIFSENSPAIVSECLEMDTVNTEGYFKTSSNVSNVNEKIQNDTASEVIVAAATLQDISCNKEGVTSGANVGDTELRENENFSTVPEVAASSAPTKCQKVSSVLKLNLEEEEAMLQRCIQLGEASKRKKLVRLKKVMSDSGGEPVCGNHIQKTSSSAVNGTLKNWKRIAYLGDFKQDDLVSPEKAAKCLKVAQKIITQKTLKIKCLRQRERRLMRKVEELENVIYHLVEKRMNPEEASTVLIVLKEND